MIRREWNTQKKIKIEKRKRDEYRKSKSGRDKKNIYIPYISYYLLYLGLLGRIKVQTHMLIIFCLQSRFLAPRILPNWTSRHEG